MFFLLSKLLYIFISPFAWFLIALYFAFFSKKELRKKRGRIAAISILLFFTNTVIYKEFCRQWEVFGTPVNKVEKADVAIVLGGMSEFNTDINTLSIRRGGDRIWQAITLYKKGKVKKLLISGDHGYVIDRGLHEAKQMQTTLVQWGIPKEDILIEEKSKNTYENAVETKKVLKKQFPEAKKFILVTSGRHMKRAEACFSKAGLKCTTYSTDLYTGPKRFYTFTDFIIPEFSVLEDWHGLIKEWIGFITYKITGKC